LLFLPGEAIWRLMNRVGGESEGEALIKQTASISRARGSEISLAPTRANRKVPHYVGDFGTGPTDSAG
jgi:hypothetical protein